jgi:hypothetical protein
MATELLQGNTNTFWLRGLKDEAAGSFINDATVTWEIRTEPWTAAGVAQGDEVAAGSGTYVTGSNGDYRCDVDAATSLVKGTKYYRRIVAVKSGVGTYLAEDQVVVARRTGQDPTT